ncbi:hypothetical protein SNAG_1209 [Streptococcus sp. NPS 308]|nr:hypothetical protein SNAG_1209 [Streptococcus sp. NPS 308]
MMREYQFDVHNEMFVSIPEERENICLTLSDSLEVINEELTPSYRAKLDNLLDQSSVWYPKALAKIQKEFTELASARLLSIFILSEQRDIDLIFGLKFGLKEDSEHGRGFKFSLNSLEILEYGLGEIAYY